MNPEFQAGWPQQVWPSGTSTVAAGGPQHPHGRDRHVGVDQLAHARHEQRDPPSRRRGRHVPSHRTPFVLAVLAHDRPPARRRALCTNAFAAPHVRPGSCSDGSTSDHVAGMRS